MVNKQLTGEVAFRVHGRPFGRQMIVLQVEETVKRSGGNNVIPLFKSECTRFRDATAEEAKLLERIDPNKPFIDEIRRVIKEQYGD